MARSNVFCEGERFYCYSLDAAQKDDERDIAAFSTTHYKGASLTTYLQYLAFAEEASGTMRTYLVRHKATDELAAFFSLKAGLATHNEEHSGQHVEFDTVPGVELANFAVNGTFVKSHEAAKGCGSIVYRELVREVVRHAAQIVGIAIVYLFALPDPKVVANYERYGFRRLSQEREGMIHSRLKPRYDQNCIFMYTVLQ